MAVYDLEEREKIEDLKAWWAQYGKYVSGAVVSVALVVIGMQGWRWYQGTQAEKASVLYQALSQAEHANDAAKAKEPVTQLVERYSRTAYAPRGVLLYAKLLYDTGEKEGAKAQLQWVIDHAGEDELKTVARFRLAEIALDEKQYDAALKMLDAKIDEAFSAMYSDLRGDILAAAGKTNDARAAYQGALAKLDAKSQYRAFVQAKLDALGGPLSSAAPAAADAQAAPAAPVK